MNIYSIALFVHAAGALGFFVALGLEWAGLRKIRNSPPSGQARAWMGNLKKINKVGFVSMLATVITGVYLTLAVWGATAWIIVTLAALGLVIALSVALTRPRMAALGRQLSMEKGLQSPTGSRLANDRLLWLSIQTRAALGLAIVFLKFAKPDLGGSLLALGVAIVLGIASALPMRRNERVLEASEKV